ncbi:MAG: DNA double-strand break repair nuclease NurA [Nitrososphaeria archaeon]
MFIRSIDELKRLIRKIEFNKTEPELMTELVNKAMRAGEGERERLRRVSQKSHELFKLLKEMEIFRKIEVADETMENLKRIPMGAVDGSFQVVGGIGGRWYAILGISQIIAENGFTLNPIVKVDGGIEPIEAADERIARQTSEMMMMLGEIKSFRKIAEKLGLKGESYIVIDGPIIDPPMYAVEEYVADRVSALKYCYERDIGVVGFVKRIMGSNYLNFLKNELEEIQSMEFTNDLDLLSTVMFDAVKEMEGPVFTSPINYEEGINEKNSLTFTYKCYKEKGLTVYYSYYKPLIRGRIFRIEYASFEELDEQNVLEKIDRILKIINKVWTLPGMDESLLTLIAHAKCNIRLGAAETLYYEIMARALSEGNLHLFLESLT